jgi:hypothetical protein
MGILRPSFCVWLHVSSPEPGSKTLLILSAWNRVLENPIADQLINSLLPPSPPPAFSMEPEDPLLRSQKPTSRSYPESSESSPHFIPCILFILILSSQLHLELPSGFLPSGVSTKMFYFSSLPFVLHTPSISSSLVCSP